MLDFSVDGTIGLADRGPRNTENCDKLAHSSLPIPALTPPPSVNVQER